MHIADTRLRGLAIAIAAGIALVMALAIALGTTADRRTEAASIPTGTVGTLVLEQAGHSAGLLTAFNATEIRSTGTDIRPWTVTHGR
jgi:hypothetical protein